MSEPQQRLAQQVQADDIVLPRQQTLIALSGVAKSLKSAPTYIKASKAGQRLSQFKGRGMEFDEARPYQAGDDIRSIDWKVTARTQKTHTKVFRQERERPVHLWVDNRNAMQFATKACFKSVIAAKVAALLAWNAIAQSDRVGGMVFSEHQHQEFRPKMGQSSVLQLIHLLSETPQKAIIDNPLDALDHAFYRLRHAAKPGSLLYLISDFNNFGDKQRAQLAQLRRHNDIALIHIYDILEQALPPSATYHLQSLGKKLCIQTKSEKVRQQYADVFKQKQNNLQKLCQKHRMRFLSMGTEDDPVELMRNWLKH